MPQISHVICPVDFTPASARALAYAAAWAARHDARLHVVHVAPIALASAPLAGVAVLVDRRPLTEVRRQLEAFVGTARLDGVEVDLKVFEGDAPAHIRAVVAEHPHALLVLGSHERTAFERFVLGSVAQRTVAATSVPVLLVPPHDAASPADSVGCKRILCAVDLLPSSLEGLRYGLSLASEAGATLDVLHVVDAPNGPQPTAHFRVPEYLRHLADTALESIRERIPAWARTACTIREAVVIGDPATSILEAAARSQADVIVMGTGDRAHLRSLWLAPTVGAVLREARCPVIVVPLLPAVGRRLALGGRVVPAAEWQQYLDIVSLRHLGHPTTLTVIAPGAADREVRELPLLGITAEGANASDIAVMLGSPGTAHLTHVVGGTVEVRVDEQRRHGITRLLLRSDDGTETVVELTSPRGA